MENKKKKMFDLKLKAGGGSIVFFVWKEVGGGGRGGRGGGRGFSEGMVEQYHVY